MHTKGYTPAHVANYLIWLSERDNITDLTPLKLIKLVYIVYAWYLYLAEERLFAEPMEAWEFGPVAPSLYHSLKHFDKSPVDEMITESDFDNDNHVTPNLPADDEMAWKVASYVWQFYKEYTANMLVNLTHEEGRAWDKARQKGKNAELNDEDIRESAKIGIEKHLIPALTHASA